MLDPHQQRFVQAPIQPRMTLWAGAGSGKTTSILAKIGYHQQQGELNAQLYRKEYGGSEFMILTFSRAACESFTTRCSNKNRDRSDRNDNSGRIYCERNFNVFTFHALAWILYHRQSSRRENNVRFDEAFYEILRLHTWNVNDFRNCKIIFVDEAQDTNHIQYQFILRFAQEIESQYGHSVSIVLIGDPNQTIYQFQGGSDRYLIEHAKDYPDSQLKLIYNYRSTPEIVAFANAFRLFTQISPMQPRPGTRLGRARKPVIHPVWLTQLRTQLIDDILEAVDHRGIAMEDIAIISPVRVSSESYDERSMRYTYQNMGLYMVLSWLRKHPRIHVQRTCAPGMNNQEKYEPRKGYINLLTIHGSKGLEFKKVILLNFHIKTMGNMPSAQEYRNYEYLWYVGVSRACQELDIYCDRSKHTWSAPLLDLNNRGLFHINMIENVNMFWNSLKSFQDLVEWRERNANSYENQKKQKKNNMLQLLEDIGAVRKKKSGGGANKGRRRVETGGETEAALAPYQSCYCGCGAPNTNHGVTDICRLIKNAVPTSPDDFIFTLRDYFNFDVTVRTIPSLYGHNFTQTRRKHSMPNFWGMYFENVFVYFNTIHVNGDLSKIPFLERARTICEVQKVYIPQTYHNVLDAMFKPLPDSRMTNLETLYMYNTEWTSLQRQLYDYLLQQLHHSRKQVFFPVKSRSLLVPEFQPTSLLGYRSSLLKKTNHPELAYRDIYHLTWIMFGFIEEYPCFYCEHQREYELRPYTWATLLQEVQGICRYIEQLHQDYHILKFNHHIQSPLPALFPIVGEADAVVVPKHADEDEPDAEILELKYISHVNIEHILQTILYSFCYHGLGKHTDHKTQIVNLQTGEVHHIRFTADQFWRLIEWICEKSHLQYMIRHCILEERKETDASSSPSFYEHMTGEIIPAKLLPFMYRPLLITKDEDEDEDEAEDDDDDMIRITRSEFESWKKTNPTQNLYNYCIEQRLVSPIRTS